MPFNMEMPLLIFSRLKEDPLLLGDWAPVRGPEEQKKLKDLFDKQESEPMGTLVHHTGTSFFHKGNLHIGLTGSPFGLLLYTFFYKDEKLCFLLSIDGQVIEKIFPL